MRRLLLAILVLGAGGWFTPEHPGSRYGEASPAVGRSLTGAQAHGSATLAIPAPSQFVAPGPGVGGPIGGYAGTIRASGGRWTGQGLHRAGPPFPPAATLLPAQPPEAHRYPRPPPVPALSG
jgi:hypothetical protein